MTVHCATLLGFSLLLTIVLINVEAEVAQLHRRHIIVAPPAMKAQQFQALPSVRQ
jgi:hypothetical protein